MTTPQDPAAPTRGAPCGGGNVLCGAATDNYKARYNADPDAPELRTWLAIHELELDGARWRVLPQDDISSRSVTLARASEERDTIQVRAAIEEGPGADVAMRAGPQRGLWGPLLTIRSRDALRRAPVRVALVVEETGSSTRRRRIIVEYRHDRELAGAGEESLEHGGPGGRWFTGSTATATNLELGWE